MELLFSIGMAKFEAAMQGRTTWHFYGAIISFCGQRPKSYTPNILLTSHVYIADRSTLFVRTTKDRPFFCHGGDKPLAGHPKPTQAYAEGPEVLRKPLPACPNNDQVISKYIFRRCQSFLCRWHDTQEPFHLTHCSRMHLKSILYTEMKGAGYLSRNIE